MIDRLPWENLQRFYNPNPKDNSRLTASDSDWARVIGTTRSRVWHWRRDGLPRFTADRIACRVVGVHPAIIWPEWFTND